MHDPKAVALTSRDDTRIAAQPAALRQAIAVGDVDVAAGRVTEYAPGGVAARMKARAKAP